jgi:hypothetical protein
MSTGTSTRPYEQDGTGGYATDDAPFAVMSSESSSSSEINWAVTSFLILWSLGLVLLGTVLALVWQDKKRLRANTNASGAAVVQEPAEDVEASSKNNHDEQAAVLLVSLSPGSRLSLAIAMFAAVTAFCVSIVPHTSCEYLELSENDRDGELISLGLWKVAYAYNRTNEDFGGENKCYSNFRTTDFQVDTALTVARVAAILSSTIGGICMLVLLYSNLAYSSSKLLSLRRLAWPLLVAAFFQGLTLSIHASDQCQASTSCNVDNGALAAITSTFYLFLCAVAIL